MSFVRETTIINKTTRQNLITLVGKVLQDASTDRRDVWSTDLDKDYRKGNVLSNGQFGMVVSAWCKEHNGRMNDEQRSCVLKIRHVGRCVDQILESAVDEKTAEQNVQGLVKRMVIDVYLMARVRHANLVHLHALSIGLGDVTFVLPHLYCLETLIEQWRVKMNGESIPAEIIMRIIRQICIALQFLSSAKIFHRTIQADHIYLTRNGTVKLGHFSAVKLTEDKSQCVTPVGSREYMCFEKQFNLCEAETREACMSYDGAADVWALGVVILRMISFFPNEQWQRLQPNFAYTMYQERMPFKWIIADLTQLRVRMRKAASGVDLCRWLSEKVFTIKAAKRCTPAQLLTSKTLKKFCSATVKQDSKYLYDRLICILDWPNRDRLETNRANYDCLESKDIPAEFYWDDCGTWKLIEKAIFEYQGKIHRELAVFSGHFLFSESQALLYQLSQFVAEGRFYWSDVLLIDGLIRQRASEAMRDHVESQHVTFSTRSGQPTMMPRWGPYQHRECSIEVRILGFNE
ncbi:unnamed protein product, partial [Mesorhabditis belari]|uniref:non-specific serine/threonine protein kinase n=1 Tax=Mesorhabditis belari TaxID=2138241 RepID=A0AAF3EI27_9BILA